MWETSKMECGRTGMFVFGDDTGVFVEGGAFPSRRKSRTHAAAALDMEVVERGAGGAGACGHVSLWVNAGMRDSSG